MNIDEQHYRAVCAMAYQVAGAAGASEQVLDCLCDAAEGVFTTDPLDCLPIELNPVEILDAEFVAAQASPDPRALDVLIEALRCTLRQHDFDIVPLEGCNG